MLVAGAVAAVALLGGLVWYGILPLYADLGCGPGNPAPTAAALPTIEFLHSSDPLFVAIAWSCWPSWSSR